MNESEGERKNLWIVLVGASKSNEHFRDRLGGVICFLIQASIERIEVALSYQNFCSGINPENWMVSLVVWLGEKEKSERRVKKGITEIVVPLWWERLNEKNLELKLDALLREVGLRKVDCIEVLVDWKKKDFSRKMKKRLQNLFECWGVIIRQVEFLRKKGGKIR